MGSKKVGEEIYTKVYAQPKIKTWVSSKYRAFVKRQPSILSERVRNNAPHHDRKGTKGGIGLKPPDTLCVSVTGQEHSDIHNGFIKLDDNKVIQWCFNSLSKYLKKDLNEFPRSKEGLIELSNWLVEKGYK